MTELKTLKDLLEVYYNEDGEEESNCVTDTILRQEAIKWVRAWTKDLPVDKVKMLQHQDIMYYEQAVSLRKAQWVKFFFNITEEDLK